MKTLGGGRRGGRIVHYDENDYYLRTVLIVFSRTEHADFWVVSSFLILVRPIAINRHYSCLTMINEELLLVVGFLC